VVSYANIDHFVPKEQAPDRMYDWTNWVYSCQRCNTNKGTVADPLLLSPVDDPTTESVGFRGAEILARDDRGAFTVRIIKLDRAKLAVARRQQLTLLCSIERHVSDNRLEPNARDIIARFLIAGVSADAPYAGMARCRYGPPPAGIWPSYTQCMHEAFAILSALGADNGAP
jgi:hypothetical protein